MQLFILVKISIIIHFYVFIYVNFSVARDTKHSIVFENGSKTIEKLIRSFIAVPFINVYNLFAQQTAAVAVCH
ncbi:hypothetical protein [Mamestra brassicae multiple nucleopolyhedrovirus]|uniref:Uncharacterized protein n=1 Tax=Mamestra brassicae nuclear polyhedrosis virus TaxID=78219 RepID=I3XMF1_NPVMB|nr:hypothetical protein [Mamestra brassicae multiple nucleopolyhedrovirus]AFL64984.1 hypothetical protein [Mamestra brassicae multiple nucleopolyhedrovirus]